MSIFRFTQFGAIYDAMNCVVHHHDEVCEIWEGKDFFCVGKSDVYPVKPFCTVRWKQHNEVLVTYADGRPDETLYF